MISHLTVSGFKAIAHLGTSQLILNHPKGVNFSLNRPNVIVGPNGSGKSALLETMALQTLSFYTGQTTLDDNYVVSHDSEAYWTKVGWGNSFEFLKGLAVKTDNAPALYYRPGHIPGNESDVSHSMMSGYFVEAKEYVRLTEEKSSGQKSLALLKKVDLALTGEGAPLAYEVTNWRSGLKPGDLSKLRHPMPWDFKAELLKQRALSVAPSALPLILLDEPEQSLDALAEVNLWKRIEQVNCSALQVVVATHSLYPLANPRKFNLIEAVPGYIQQVQHLLGIKASVRRNSDKNASMTT